MSKELPFKSIWLVDFEFIELNGERPDPVCMVAHELKRGTKLRLWRDQLGPSAPFDLGDESLYVAFNASAELGCHLALGWPMPRRVLDLYVEFRVLTNGAPTPSGDSLLGALTYFNLDSIGVVEKQSMIELILGGKWTEVERKQILLYCESDVYALARLLPPMLRCIDLPRALLRGRYMPAVANMVRHGVPLDAPLLGKVREHWDGIKTDLIASIDKDYNVYDNGSFKELRFERWLRYSATSLFLL